MALLAINGTVRIAGSKTTGFPLRVPGKDIKSSEHFETTPPGRACKKSMDTADTRHHKDVMCKDAEQLRDSKDRTGGSLRLFTSQPTAADQPAKERLQWDF